MKTPARVVRLAFAVGPSGVAPLPGTSYTAVRRTLLYDYRGAGFVLENLEGMTWGPTLSDGSRVILLISDDNFDRGQETQILALRVAYSATRGGS